MRFRDILWGAVVVLSLQACEKEDTLHPRSGGASVVYEFPEGDDAWDRDLEEIAERFGVKCIYKNLTLEDLTRTWTASGSVTEYVGQGLNSDRQKKLYTQFFKNHVFRFLNPEVTKAIFPNYILFAHDFCSVNYRKLPSGDTLVWHGQPKAKYNGMGFWAFCFESEEHLNVMEVPWKQEMFTDGMSVWQNREMVLKNIFSQLVNTGVIVPPVQFAIGGGLDYTTPVVSGAANVDKDHYYKRRGFPVQMRNLASYVARPTDMYNITSASPMLTFIDYLWLAFRYPREVILADYKDFPLVIQYYELTVAYVREKYGMDISLISGMPEGLEVEN